MKHIVRLSAVSLSILFGSCAAAPSMPLDPVRAVATTRFDVTVDRTTLKLPYYANTALDETNPAIIRAVIAVHGADRNADRFFEGVRAAARRATAENSTLIIAPQFLELPDIEHHKPGSDVLFWSGGWRQGDPSRSTRVHRRRARVSSFEAIDQMVLRLADGTRFPNLKHIVIAGHSAGGQFVNRYAAGNRVEDLIAPSRGIDFRYVVANPSSYLYFDGERRIGGEGDRFATPSTSECLTCPTYNQYRYGLDHLNSYMATVGTDTIAEQYGRRHVVYLVGELDNRDELFLDRTCRANLQGAHRLERAIIYYSYLQHHFGPEIAANHHLAIVPETGHNSYRMFGSEPGLRYLFDHEPADRAASPAATSRPAEALAS